MDSQNIFKQKVVAYFCMEYALERNINLYAGGLGILAGDYLKAAKDKGYPVVGIGILWKQGYTTQRIDRQGRVIDSYCNYKSEYGFLEDTGVTVDIRIKEEDVKCKVWKTENFENNTLYLLDTDIPENNGTELKWTTGQLYGGFEEQRIAQEMVLGIGGIRALRELGIRPDIYHFNEGHAVFAGFEIIREKLVSGMEFEQALESTKKSIVFTTHTPVKQGNESHSLRSLMYMGANDGLEASELKRIGGDPFNMTVAGLRLSKISNGVSRLHAQTANEMWREIEGKSNIIQITNGIHIPTWVNEDVIQNMDSDELLWGSHLKHKRLLIDYIYEKTGSKFKQDILTIGFARRVVPYKRANLIMEYEPQLQKLMEAGKIQIVLSGKSHPLDDEGKLLVKKIHGFCKRYPKNTAFIQNYDIENAKALTKGCDVWLNTPRKPYEASGTSGMKAALNGVLNLSVLDGWWEEACIDGENGWQFGDGLQMKNDVQQDRHDGEALMKILLEKVIPTYYEDRTKWVDMMRKSISTNIEHFDMKRTIDEYREKMYDFQPELLKNT
ncbi:starch phosphorylase [Peptoclostridium litorale DSM 5388]|uniref:glycogen phosphorylase n=1 Tax=Peptoclostridium litorale DSM 5388 TaxID=1121324 RepID=A0A069RH96_PEPLI|nr:alpha-glucan family phosphorylase [Peptoclostridium litorale]KDR96138.1 glycogen phosphorylase GlgP [Peptoclostridium litorale DSM 5388]SIO03805.1 starch phosphorylase [Peptoclostridium litorale DSM 5388]